MDLDLDKIFQNSAMSHRMEVFVNESINLNDPLFIENIGCTIREYRVLRMIDEHGGIGFKDITRITGLERSLVSRLIRILLERELIYRVSNKTDARRFGLFTTETGNAACDRGRQLTAQAEENVFEPLLEGELEQLNSILNKLAFWVRTEEYKRNIHREPESDN